MEFRARNGIFLRFAVGYTVMLNTGAFTNRDFGGYYGELGHSVVGFDPVSAADAHDNGVAMSFLFTHVDLGGLLNL
jgi:hypothetical protein